MKKYIIAILSALVVFFASCDNDTDLSGVSLDKSSITIPAGGSYELVASLTPADVYGNLKWSSSNNSIATVENGMVIGVAEGTAQIAVSVGEYSATCAVTVTKAITAITLNKSSLRLRPDSMQTLTAQLSPTVSSEVNQNIRWISTNSAVATVDNAGKVTAVSNGSTNIVASIGTVTASCAVTVYTTVPTALMGSNYYLIFLDNAAASMIESQNIAADYRINDTNYNFYIWNGLADGVKSGSNFFATSSDWLSLVVTGAGGWSGCAFNLQKNSALDKLKAVTDDTSGKYYLHFAIKSSSTNSYAFKAGYGASGVTFVLGTTSMENTAPYGNFTRNGQWQEVEIPISYLKTKGLVYTNGMATTDIFVMLAGGVAGVKLDIDAVFIYKKP